MTLEARITAVVQAIGADIKALQSAPATDVFANYVSVHLPLDGVVTNPFIHNTSRPSLSTYATGGVTLSGSGPFTGKAAHFATVADCIALNLLEFPSDFFCEAWVYIPDIAAANTVFAVGSAAAGSIGFYVTTAGKLELSRYGDSNTTGATTLALNQWHHVAAAKFGTSYMVFLNGVLDGASTSSFVCTKKDLKVGAVWGAGFRGAMADVRLTGAARFTASFARPTAQHPPAR